MRIHRASYEIPQLPSHAQILECQETDVTALSCPSIYPIPTAHWRIYLRKKDIQTLTCGGPQCTITSSSCHLTDRPLKAALPWPTEPCSPVNMAANVLIAI